MKSSWSKAIGTCTTVFQSNIHDNDSSCWIDKRTDIKTVLAVRQELIWLPLLTQSDLKGMRIIGKSPINRVNLNILMQAKISSDKIRGGHQNGILIVLKPLLPQLDDFDQLRLKSAVELL